MWKENYKFVIAGKRCPINQELDMTKTKVKHKNLKANAEPNKSKSILKSRLQAE